MPGQIPANTHHLSGSHGYRLSRTQLPPADVAHWTPARKAEVVEAVRDGMASLEDVCERYAMAVDEFMSWSHAMDEHGLSGLQVGNIQRYRH